MLQFPESLITRIIPIEMYQQLGSLWQKTAEVQPGKIVAINEADLINNNTSKSFPGINFKHFHLIIASNLQVLLLVEKQIDDLSYQIGLTFAQPEIADFYQLLENQIYPQLKEKISRILRENKVDKLDDLDIYHFVSNLLKILTEPLAIKEAYDTNSVQKQSISKILTNRIKQEKILSQVGQQIRENLDLLVIVKMTIEQVQNLLQIDRLVVYQISAPVKSELKKKVNFIDTVTFQAKASELIPSILGFEAETCFSHNYDCQQKYLNGFQLVIDDLDNCDLDDCLKELMRKLVIKAKVVVPIIVKNKLWGLLIAHQCFTPRKWKPSEITFLKHISEYLAIAIYQSNSYNQLQEQKKLLEQEVEKKARQLQDALISAEIAHQSKTEFLGSISHELRTPLTCVIGLAGTLLHWSKAGNYSVLDQEKQRRYLKIIQDSGRKLLELINNILDFADIEAGKSLLQIQPISLENVSKMVLLYGLEIAKNKEIKVTLDYQVEPDLDLFNADPERLYQILINVVDNAIKFTASGGKVNLKVWRHKNQAIFAIEDTGIGIYQEQIPLLFNKFKQLENYRTRTHPGTGLGLALTKHLVELHGGMIEVESIVNQGSTFTIYLPDSPPPQPPDWAEKNVRETSKTNQNKTIVIICNDDEVATFLCELLTAAEYQVIWLVDVIEVINRLKLIKPKIVIIEQNKEISRQLSQQIKSFFPKDLYLILIKDKISGNEWEKLSNLGIDEYLLKPLQPNALLKKVNKIMSLSEGKNEIIIK
jgi:two-component system sensor histidine kinase/response regulator